MSRQMYLTGITAAASCCLIGIVLCLLSQTIARSVFSTGLFWTGELARFLAVWGALLGAAAGREAGLLHVVDAVITRLPDSVTHIITHIRALVVIALLLFLIYAGIEMTERALPQVSSAMQISMAWVYAALPVTAALMLITELANLFHPSRSNCAQSDSM